MYYIVRNNQPFGPYSLDLLRNYVEEGKILLNDTAIDGNNRQKTVRYFLQQHRIKVKIKNEGAIADQIKRIGKSLIMPSLGFIKSDLLKDKKVLTLAAVGLAPAFLISFISGISEYLTFYAISLYFSVIWGIFFYFMFKTRQIENGKTVLIFFLTQLTALVIVNVQVLPPMNILYGLTRSDSLLLRLVGFILGVGCTEEFIKAVPLLYLVKHAKEPIIPQTLVFYGLISGIGFGVLEGVLYQTTTNTQLGYSEAFFMNISRLTCLPFLHAVWAGIAGYFVAFANLFPKYRKSLYVLAIGIPAVLHGVYDVLGWTLPGLGCTLVSVLLLMYYLKKSADYQHKLVHIP
jgi:RsiW-degrading membrane proteinase PrsW (M82 family)